MTITTDSFAAIGDLSVAFAPPNAARMSDDELLAAQSALAQIGRRVGAAAATVAGEIAHRSRPDLGEQGLARRRGARTPEILVQQISGGSADDARSLVRVGRLIDTTDADTAPDPSRESAADEAPWLKPVAEAVAAGRLSIAQADAIRGGLGTVDEHSPAGLGEALARAALELLRDCGSLTVEKLASRARFLRAELDAAAAADGERRLRERRYLRLIPQRDGMTRITGLLDPESAALVGSAIDAATSPRRGGPRFVDPDEGNRAEELARDPRSIEQIALDSMVELIRIGGQADASKVLGARRPAVRILVTARDLAEGTGFGTIEGQADPVSLDTVRRTICSAGAVPIMFDRNGQGVDLGRTVRLHTARQRLIIAARDGGCIFPGCDRPPSWCEVHHPETWHRGGGTSIENGVLLCRHHHLLIHNDGWEVIHRDGEYQVVPPASVDPARKPLPAPSKSPTLRRLLHQTGVAG
ncbi:MAG: DUF222 domain-containing protein [Schumannella sp.]